MKRKATIPLMVVALTASACTAAYTPETSQTSSPTPTEGITVEHTDVSVKSTDDLSGFWRTEHHTDAYGAPITLAGVRAPESLQDPVDQWASDQAQDFTKNLEELKDKEIRKNAELKLVPGICGASGNLLCYTLDARASYPPQSTSSPSPSAPKHSNHYHAWITNSEDGLVLDSLDMLSQPGREKISQLVPEKPTAIYPNADGSLTVVVDDDTAGYRVNFANSSDLDALLSPDGKKLHEQFMASADPEPISKPETDCKKYPCVALTFDDGPGPYTDQLLDTLKEKDAKATFFLIGKQAANYPDQVKREQDEGHVVGNHTWSHLDLSKQSAATITNQVAATDQAIEAAGVSKPELVRPPYGSANGAVHSILASRGQAEIHWSVDSLDWKNRDVQKDITMVTSKVGPGSIVLMHDIHPETVQAVPEIIDDLHLAGYDLVTVPELLGGPAANYLGFPIFSQQSVG